MIVLGISRGHDATAALVVDGEIVAVTAEERITRKKHQPGFPAQAIREVLDISGISPNQVDRVAIGGRSWQRLTIHEWLWHILGREPYRSMSFYALARNVVVQNSKGLLKLKRNLRQAGLSGKPIHHIDHHLAHASSAYRTSGMKNAAIVTVDGWGDDVSSTVSLGREGVIQRLASSSRVNSWGSFYQAVTEALGFAPIEGENKTMGLAAYGSPRDLHAFMQGIAECDGLTTISHIPWKPGELVYGFPGIRQASLFKEKLADGYSRESLAAACQKRLEDIMVSLIRNVILETGRRSICAAGGVFLNVKANKRILEETDVEDYYIFPDAGDGGLAVGAALQVCFEQSRIQSYRRLEHVYYGREFQNHEIEQELKRWPRLCYRRVDDISLEAAHLLASGKVIGWFQGRMEMGPRALGNRSVLANPKTEQIKDRINLVLKKRDWFVPFAPSMLATKASHYLESYRESPFMILAFDVKPHMREMIPAVTHVDGTARPQEVRQEINPRYWRLISEFERLQGLPVILNTSFNRHGAPIVRSPGDALDHLAAGNVDLLCIGDYIVERQPNS